MISEGKVNNNAEYDRGRYSEILKNRLKDLNEWIFHIERHNKDPQQEKQLSSCIQKEIERMETEEASKLRKTNLRTSSRGTQ